MGHVLQVVAYLAYSFVGHVPASKVSKWENLSVNASIEYTF